MERWGSDGAPCTASPAHLPPPPSAPRNCDWPGPLGDDPGPSPHPPRVLSASQQSPPLRRAFVFLLSPPSSPGQTSPRGRPLPNPRSSRLLGAAALTPPAAALPLHSLPQTAPRTPVAALPLQPGAAPPFLALAVPPSTTKSGDLIRRCEDGRGGGDEGR